MRSQRINASWRGHPDILGEAGFGRNPPGGDALRLAIFPRSSRLARMSRLSAVQLRKLPDGRVTIARMVKGIDESRRVVTSAGGQPIRRAHDVQDFG